MKNKIQHHVPWEPTCWVVSARPIELCNLADDSRQKYAATKATAAILRAMRK